MSGRFAGGLITTTRSAMTQWSVPALPLGFVSK